MYYNVIAYLQFKNINARSLIYIYLVSYLRIKFHLKTEKKLYFIEKFLKNIRKTPNLGETSWPRVNKNTIKALLSMIGSFNYKAFINADAAWTGWIKTS